jgi:hypothetical protein
LYDDDDSVVESCAIVREQSAWCLGNIAGDSPEFRDYVLQCGALRPLLHNIDLALHQNNITNLNNYVWSLSIFCRGKPQVNMDQISEALPYLSKLVDSCPSKEALMDV